MFLYSLSWDFSKLPYILGLFISFVFPSLLPLPPCPTHFGSFHNLGPGVLPQGLDSGFIGISVGSTGSKSLSWSSEVAWGSSRATHIKHADCCGAEDKRPLIILLAPQSKHSSPPTVWSLVVPTFAPYQSYHSLSRVKCTIIFTPPFGQICWVSYLVCLCNWSQCDHSLSSSVTATPGPMFPYQTKQLTHTATQSSSQQALT